MLTFITPQSATVVPYSNNSIQTNSQKSIKKSSVVPVNQAVVSVNEFQQPKNFQDETSQC